LFPIYLTYNKKLTINSPRPLRMMPKTPPMPLRPITPKVTEAMKITKKSEREFHHFASGAEKQTMNHNSPAIDNMMLAIPNGFIFPRGLNYSQLEFAFHAVNYYFICPITATVRGAIFATLSSRIVRIVLLLRLE
jgi:hypothetical protein